MNYLLQITQTAREQLRALPKRQRHIIGKRLTVLQSDLKGDTYEH